MPTGAPASHGCVRMILGDAQWIYNWADPWVTTSGSGERGLGTAAGRILQQGTTVLVLGDGEEPSAAPERFVDIHAVPVFVDELESLPSMLSYFVNGALNFITTSRVEGVVCLVCVLAIAVLSNAVNRTLWIPNQ